MKSVGIISMASYMPGNKIDNKLSVDLVDFLRKNTKCPEDYILSIEKTSSLPGRIETNAEGWENQPWFDAWLKAMPEKKRKDPFQGTVERRRVPMDPSSLKESIYPYPMLPSDAEIIPASIAILRSGLNPDDIDLLMCHSQVPDRPLPTNVSLLQDKLGLKNAGAYSMDTCCSSFVTMIEVATALVKSGIKKNVLIVSSYLDSHVNDKSTYFSVDTGDGAVAGIISACESGYLASHSSSHGTRHDGIIFETRLPTVYKGTHLSPDYRQMFTTFCNKEANKEIAKNAGIDMKFVVDKALEKASMKTEEIDFFVTHQPVAWSGELWRETVGVPKEKFYESFKKYGNIATAAAATNLTEALEKELIKEGDKVLIASSGAGENHIAILHQVSETLIKNMNRYKS